MLSSQPPTVDLGRNASGFFHFTGPLPRPSVSEQAALVPPAVLVRGTLELETSSSLRLGSSSSRPDIRLRFGDLLNELGRVERPSCRRGDEPSWGDDSPRLCKSER